MISYYKICAQLSYRLVQCVEYTGFTTKMEGCFLPCLSCLANGNRFIQENLKKKRKKERGCELLHMRNYMCLADA